MFFLLLVALFYFLFLTRFIAVVSIVSFLILASWPPVLQYQLPALLFVCVLFDFVFVVVSYLSGAPK